MNKRYILKKNHDIEALVSYRQSVGNKYYAVYYKKVDDTKVVVSVSKKLGKAYLRNYLKRVTKEIIRVNMELYIGYNLLIVVKTNAINLSFSEKTEQLLKLIKKLKVENK